MSGAVTPLCTAPVRPADTPAWPLPPADITAGAVAWVGPVGLLLSLVCHYPGSIARRSSLGPANLVAELAELDPQTSSHPDPEEQT
jgi:hypothetical protein